MKQQNNYQDSIVQIFMYKSKTSYISISLKLFVLQPETKDYDSYCKESVPMLIIPVIFD